MDRPRAIRHDELLEQMGWVQALAASLVRDPNVADDVVQQTWLTALERPPRETSGPSLRAWLAAVTRTLARQSMRSETRRTAREQRVAAEVSTVDESALDVVQRGEVQRDLVEHVLALDEPYRSTVLLRYLDGLDGREIAERCGVSHAAARKRLSRGLALLRERLDERHDGDCRAWLAAFLLPSLGGADAAGAEAGERVASASTGDGAATREDVVGPSDGTRSPTGGVGRARLATRPLGALPQTVALVGTGGLLVVVAAAIVGGWFEGSGSRATPTPLPLAARPGDAPNAPTAASVPDRGAAAPLAARADVDTTGLAPTIGLAPVGVSVAGRVLDADGDPLPDLRVRFEPVSGDEARPGAATLTAFSGPDGAFRIDGLTGRGRLLVASSTWVTLLAGDATPPVDPAGATVVAAPRARLAGRVLDPAGAPVDGARLEVLPPDDLLARLGADLGASWPVAVTTRADADGRFALPRAPRLDGARLRVTAPGFRADERLLPADDDALTVVLAPPPARLAGRVVDATWRPVPGAVVGWGARTATADVDGAFTFRCEPEELAGDRAPPTLVAIAEGFAPARVDVPHDADDAARWPGHLEVRLPGPALQLEGEVVDADGAPVPNAIVWLADPTVLTAGAGEEGSVERSGTPEGAPEGARVVVAEWLLAGARDDRWSRTSTDASGRFTLAGLADRPYVVAALTRRSLVHAESAPTRPGDTARIVLPRADVHPALHGRLVDRAGRPLAGVEVSTRRPAARAAHTTWIVTGRATTSDADGRFTLDATARDGALLRLDGPGLLAHDVPVPDAASSGPFELVVPGRRDLRVRLADPGEADGFRVEDAAGTPLPLHDLRHDRALSRPTAALRDGRSARLAVSEDAAVLVLLRDGAPVRRVPLRLRPDRVNEIR